MVEKHQHPSFWLWLLALSSCLFWATNAFAEEDAAEEQTDAAEQAAAESQAEPDAQGEPSDDSGESKPAAKDEKSPFEAVMALNAPTEPSAETTASASENEEGATATLPLEVFSRLSERESSLQQKKASTIPVIVGAASYEGQVERGVLALRMKLLVTLAGEGLKFVPLVGDDVSLVSVQSEGESLGVTRRSGYHVWVTRRQGTIPIEISLLVASHGGRGSVEYAFRVARTPSTHANVRLPMEGLSPRFDGAIQNLVRHERGSTYVEAALSPTEELRLVGFRDVGTEEQQSARSLVETLSLLSVDEHAVELFSVLRYTILRGAAQSFDIVIPAGLEVVSAAGEGAFHYSIEERADDSLLRGETALPVEGSYEISLRLRKRERSLMKELDLRLPHSLGVEREHGWLAVEVPGKIRMAETSRKDLVAVAVSELPLETRSSAISPVLHAYRYHAGAPRLGFSVERLPEQDLEEGSIDAIDATSVVAGEGKLVTEMRISLRNANRPALAMTLPEGATLQKAWLDGEPVRPSLDEKGRLLLPLSRSTRKGDEVPMVLEVVLESTLAPLGFWGRADLVLPALDLGAAALRWKLLLPSNNRYGDLEARLAPQTYMGSLSWHKPPHLKRAVRYNEEESDETKKAEHRASAFSLLSATGTRMEHQRYWLSAGEAPTLRVPFMRSSLMLPLQMAIGGFALGLGSLLMKRFLARRLTSKMALRARLELAATRLVAWYRRQTFTRRRILRALALAMSSVGVLWFFLHHLVGFFKIAYALVSGDA